MPDLASVLPTVEGFLADREGRDLFETDRIIVPNAGVRAWLLQQIAERTGCTATADGRSRVDGVAMNIDIEYLGAIDRFLGRERGAVDPWDVEHLTMSVLGVVAAPDPLFADQVERLGGGLRAARAIADRFDRYNARRPAMVEEWEKGNAVLSPEVGAAVGDGEHPGEHLVTLPPLAAEDMWQFELWQRVRRAVDREPWPVLVRRVIDSGAGQGAGVLPARLLVAGLQSLSVRHAQALRALSRWIPVTVVMVHPSPVLAARWSDAAAGLAVTPGIAPLRDPDERFDDTVDPLVESWLRGSREMQAVLASQGLGCEVDTSPDAPALESLLARVKATVVTGTAADGGFDPADMSLRLHRAHNLARQVEVVRDAVVHALVDIKGLEPHEIVVLCADIAAAAPLVKSAFAKEYVINGEPRTVPVVVADRSLRQVDPGSQLLADLVRAVRGRFPVADVLAVATSPVVMRHFQSGPDDVAAWRRFIDNAVVRWGLDADQRARRGVALGVPAHTWSLAIERALLGAVLDDGEPQPGLGGVVPMQNLDSADVRPVSVLARIVSVLAGLEEAVTTGERTVTGWCEAVEDALCELCDPSTGGLDDALGALASMCAAVPVGADTVPVRFDHFADLLVELVEQVPGRQPLRTGAVTVTSMIPLRSVPFRVVCLVGFDEGTGSAGEAEGDDLTERQRFVGDIDPRLDGRRAILDAVCAASERVVITCNGRHIKDNKELPLITPLAEFIDLCVRCGAGIVDDVPVIEHLHPRHFLSPLNFVAGGVGPGIVWSHDSVTAAAVGGAVAPAPAGAAVAVVAAPAGEVPFAGLEKLRRNPLRTFLNDGLRIDTWKDAPEDEPATVPLQVDNDRILELAQDLLAARLSGFDDAQWRKVQETTGNLPVGEYKVPVTRHVTAVVNSLADVALGWGFDTGAVETLGISVPVGNATVTGSVKVHRTVENRLVFDPFLRGGKELSVESAALLLLCLVASGEVFDGALVLNHHSKDQKTQARFVELDPAVTRAVASSRVADLVGLLHRAGAAPFPMFGDTWSLLSDPDPTGAVHAFDSCLRSENYPASLESLLYGPRPRFDAVYPDPGAERQFFSDLVRAVPQRDAALGKAAGSVKPPKPSKTVRTLSTRYVFA
ncbi:MAG: exodeoxyribonuclease V subunit gamma [Acidimicrobiales bacterium]